MALDAVHGLRGRMPKLGDGPLRCRVALRTVVAEEFEVPILAGMAGRAIQFCLLRSEARMTIRSVARSLMLANPIEEVFSNPIVLTVASVFLGLHK